METLRASIYQFLISLFLLTRAMRLTRISLALIKLSHTMLYGWDCIRTYGDMELIALDTKSITALERAVSIAENIIFFTECFSIATLIGILFTIHGLYLMNVIELVVSVVLSIMGISSYLVKYYVEKVLSIILTKEVVVEDEEELTLKQAA